MEQTPSAFSSASLIDETARRLFEAAWRRGAPDPIERFLPSPQQPEFLPTLEELVHIDLEMRWLVAATGAEPFAIEAYLERFPQLRDPAILLRLVQQEFQLRCRRGEQASLAGYRQRFPALPIMEGELETVVAAKGKSLPEASGAVEAPTIPGYEILGVLGRGGMGVVYRARQLTLGREVALKMILAGGQAGSDEVLRFRQEAEAVAHLQHPNIVQIHEVGEQNGQPYFSLEYVGGGALDRRLGGRPQPAREAAILIKTLAQAIQFAHQHGIVHRDLKPANILLAVVSGQGSGVSKEEQPKAPLTTQHWSLTTVPKITDFGLAKRLESERGQTRTGEILGTPSYMAPEQASGKSSTVGPAVDVYALGAILYEMLTGQPPFRGESPMQTVLQVVTEEPVPPRRLQPRVPRDLETICLKCLEKDPQRRYGSAQELADDLGRFLADEPIRARPAGLGERFLKWSRRRPTAATVLVLGIFSVLAAGTVAGWYWNACLRLKTEYYTYMVIRSGAPFGIGPVTEQQASHRQVTCKFYRRAGYVEKVEMVNGLGFLTDQHGFHAWIDEQTAPTTVRRECWYAYKRNQQGQVSEQIAYDRGNDVVWKLVFTTSTTGHFTDKDGFPLPRVGSGAAYVEFRWSHEGMIEEVHFLDRNGKRQPNQAGIYGRLQENNERGLGVRYTYLGPQYQPALHRQLGFAAWTAVYDEHANRTQVDHLDRNGLPTWQRNGFARLVSTYDEYGNKTSMSYFDCDGKPTGHKDGYARVVYTYDEHGNRTTVAFFGTDGKPALHKDGYARMTQSHDEQGQAREQAFFDRDGKPTRHKDNHAKIAITCDAQGNRTELAYFGVDGKPTLHQGGHARVVMTYDEHGNRTSTTYFDLDGKPTSRQRGFARLTRSYDARGNCLSEAYFDEDNKPALVKQGYVRITWVYDRKGNKTEETYLDRDGRLTPHIEGFAVFKRKFDEHGNLLEQTFFDKERQPVTTAKGYEKILLKHDDAGNRISVAYCDRDNRPVLVKEGYARFADAYDDRGNLTEESYFGLEGEPVLVKNGYAKIVWRLDERGNKIETAYFDQEGKPTLHKAGYAKVTTGHDERGNRTEEAYWLAGGQATVHKGWGAARVAWKYDDRGAATDISFFDVKGKPVEARVWVLQVSPGGQGERLGLKPRDILVSYDGKPIRNSFHFESERKLEVPGTGQKELTIRRGGKTMTLRAAPQSLNVVLENRAAGP